MITFSRRTFLATAATSSLALMAGTGMADAENLAKRAKIDSEADASLQQLLAGNKHAGPLRKKLPPC
ncbi:MAG: hypothetical protein ACU0CA_11590 [Paracoccaceae bacterium]